MGLDSGRGHGVGSNELRPVHTMRLYHTILLYCYVEIEEIIYESVNWKGVVTN